MRLSTKARMNRLFRNGGCLDVAIDHGVCNEPSFLVGLEDMAGVVDMLVRAGPDAIQASKGYSETNEYVRNILRGSNPSTRSVRAGGGGGGRRSGGGGAGRWGSASLRLVPGGAANLTALLSELTPQRQRPAISPPAALAFSAQAPTPANYQGVQETPEISQARTDVGLPAGNGFPQGPGGPGGPRRGPGGLRGLGGGLNAAAQAIGITPEQRFRAGMDPASVRVVAAS